MNIEKTDDGYMSLTNLIQIGMATDNQLRARVKPSEAEYLDSIATTLDEDRAEAERKVIEEGFAALGYIDRPTKPHELLLWYVRRIGLVLGFVGLILMGYGVFGPRLFSLIGFGITLSGFLLVALEGFLDAYSESSQEVTLDE